MTQETTILGVQLNNRTKIAQEFQEVVTKYGCSIKTRIGLHTADNDFCSPNGLILLQLVGDQKEKSDLENAINGIDGAQVQKMTF